MNKRFPSVQAVIDEFREHPHHSDDAVAGFEDYLDRAVFAATLRPQTWLTEGLLAHQTPTMRCHWHCVEMRRWVKEIGSALRETRQRRQYHQLEFRKFFDSLECLLKERLHEWNWAQNCANVDTSMWKEGDT